MPAPGRILIHNLPKVIMKKLLFDDYQSSAGKYVVREVDEDGHEVVPSIENPPSRWCRRSRRRPSGEMEIPDFFDLDSDAPYSETEPKSEFHSLANKVLLVLKDVLFAHSVAFFWANRREEPDGAGVDGDRQRSVHEREAICDGE